MGNPEIDDYEDKRWHDSDGKLHRDDGPAIEYASGRKVWYQHGLRHRDDGPAIEWPNGAKRWWLNHQCLSFEAWLGKVDISDEVKVMLKLKYG